MSTADGDVSESLSDIDDTEVARYLNTKEAALCKSIIWEVMNKDYNKGKIRKRARKAKAAAPAKKAVKVSTVMDNKTRLSSKIDFDALKKLDEELGIDSPGIDEGTNSNRGTLGDMRHSNEKNSFEGSQDDESEHVNTSEDRQGYDDDTYFANDECNGYNYNYDEECDFDEF